MHVIYFNILTQWSLYKHLFKKKLKITNIYILNPVFYLHYNQSYASGSTILDFASSG